MSSLLSSIKPNNHKIHPCISERKVALCLAIILKNKNKNIIITTAGDTKILEDEISFENVKIFTDKNLIQNNKENCELLISFDLPNKAIIYDARLVHTSSNAILLLSKNEQVLLYPIETLLGRVIKQEVIEGYEEPKNEKDDDKKTHIKTMTKDQIKEVAKKRYEKSTMPQEKKEYDDKKPAYKKTDKKPSFKNSKPKKKGRTINIKALKKSEN
jgi:hypothetical protein